MIPLINSNDKDKLLIIVMNLLLKKTSLLDYFFCLNMLPSYSLNLTSYVNLGYK